MDTLGEDNIRSLSVLLITDLLGLEEDGTRAAEIAKDLAALAEDLLLAGAFEDARLVIRSLKQASESPTAVAPAACRAAITSLGGSLGLREAVSLLGDLDDTTHTVFAECCALVGPSATQALVALLDVEQDTTAFNRAREIVRNYGAAAIQYLGPLVDDERWFVQRTVARLLAATRSPNAVAPLHTLLRRGDERVLPVVISGLAGIDDPSALRVIRTALRLASGAARGAVIGALVVSRDPQIVPLLARLLTEIDPFGSDHQVVLDTLDAIRQIGDDRAVSAVATVMRKKRFFSRRKSLAFKTASARALRAVDTDGAREVLNESARSGDRLLRRPIAEHA